MGTVETQGQFQDTDPQSLPKEHMNMRSFFSKDTTPGRRVAGAITLLALMAVLGGLVTACGGDNARDAEAKVTVTTAVEMPAVTNSVPGQNETEVDIEAACAQLGAAMEELQALMIASPEGTLYEDLVLTESITTSFNELAILLMEGPAFDAVVTVRDTAQVSVDAQSAILEWSFTNCGMEVGP